MAEPPAPGSAEEVAHLVALLLHTLGVLTGDMALGSFETWQPLLAFSKFRRAIVAEIVVLLVQ